jgi:hypothetical protein
MLAHALLFAALVQSPTASVDTSRTAFTECLRREMRSDLEAKVTPADFTAALASKCDTSRKAFRAANIAADRASGDSEAVAAESADLQIADYHQSFAEKFKDFSESNSLPAN